MKIKQIIKQNKIQSLIIGITFFAWFIAATAKLFYPNDIILERIEHPLFVIYSISAIVCITLMKKDIK